MYDYRKQKSNSEFFKMCVGQFYILGVPFSITGDTTNENRSVIEAEEKAKTIQYICSTFTLLFR